MKVDVTKKENLQRELSVEIPADEVTKQLDLAFAELRRTVSLDGFRKGKVPMNVIRSRFGDKIRMDVADQLIQDSFPRAVEESRLAVATRPTVTSVDFADNGAFRYTAAVEVLPGIETVQFDQLTVTSADVTVKDEDVDALAESVRRSFAEFRTVERAATGKDLVVADLKKLRDPRLVLSEEVMDDVEIDLERNVTVREFQEQVPGMAAGDQKEIEVVYDDDYPDPKFAGASITYLCTVKEVKERILPDFDDTLAKRTGKAETALELKMKLREDLGRQQSAQLRKLQKGQVIRQVCEQNAIPVPTGMVEDYLNAMIKDEKDRNPDIDEEPTRTAGRPIAENTLRWHMLYHHIAEQEKIQISPADTDQFIKGVAADHNITEEQARTALERTGKLSSVRDTLLEEKVLDFLIGRAKVAAAQTDTKLEKDNT